LRCPPELLIDFSINYPLPERILQIDAGSPLATFNDALQGPTGRRLTEAGGDRPLEIVFGPIHRCRSNPGA